MTRRRVRSPLDFDESFTLVLQDYQDFVTRQGRATAAEEPKEFATRHAAARGALAHLEHLMKLAGRDDGAALAARQAALDAARAEIGATLEGGDDDD